MMKFYKKSLMKNLPAHTPVLVVGGGIAGAGVFRDLSLHNVGTVLIDSKDFTSQTSQSSSKMLHGGIRYLENMDFALVWEALHEKNLWLNLTPHLTYPESFYLPVYKGSLRPLWMVKIGLFLYDLLSSFKNTPHSIASKKKTLEIFPFLKSQGLTGAGVYSDAVVDDAKMTLECIYDGMVSPHSYACNHVSFIDVKKLKNEKKEVYEVKLKDEISGETKAITTDYLVFTTGPFTDKVLSKQSLFPWTPKLRLSRGSHLWFDNEMLKIQKPMVLTPKDGRVIFVIPQKDKTLVGTTEVKGSADFDQTPSDQEIAYLFKNLEDYFPNADINKKYLLGSFAGVRPLVMEDPNSNLGEVARNHKIYQPREDVFILMGGKYTTFRVMAADLVEPLLHKMKIPYLKHLSTLPLRRKGHIAPWSKFELNENILKKIIEDEFPKNQDDLIIRRLGINQQEHYQLVEEKLAPFKSLFPWEKPVSDSL